MVAAAVAPAPVAAPTPTLTEVRTFFLFAAGVVVLFAGLDSVLALDLDSALFCAIVLGLGGFRSTRGALLPDRRPVADVVRAELLGFLFAACRIAFAIFFLIIVPWVNL